MKKFFMPFVFFAVLACATVPNKIERPDPFFSKDAWPIQSGAQIDILVQGEPSFSEKDLIVDSEGTIYYQPLGKLSVTQYTHKELEDYLKERLSEVFFHNPKVSVTVDNNVKIYILGEVESPGLFEISHPMTILEAIKLAGNFSNQSQRDTIRIVRQTAEGEKIKEISLKKIGSTWFRNEKIYIMPGDVIMVN